eukprot:CAMPEP_0119177560 /NCGR_PEP_ID=MMETSP1315-20130426/49084_1 /TAXON_ID=676789 /ORGANISM="Prasinoderma singularis, Strain RCC927" /LENGTH=81 /DNA_ID=CAMNT_0007171715 /DNA_START=12 /DNA_END=254 /DNA_ORIENTATION=+
MKGMATSAPLLGAALARTLVSTIASASPTLSATTCCACILAEISAMLSVSAKERWMAGVMLIDVDTPIDFPTFATVASGRK